MRACAWVCRYNELKTLLALRTLSLNTNLRVLRVHPNPVTYTDRCVSSHVCVRMQVFACVFSVCARELQALT